jgi:hypothetical protein
MPFKAITAKLTGNPTEDGLVRVGDHVVNEGKYKLHTVIVVRGETEEESLNMAKTAQDALVELFSAYEKEGVFNGLSTSVEKVYINSQQTDPDLGIAVVVVRENILYIAASGDVEVSLFREGKIHKLIKGVKDRCLSASGQLKEDDIVVCGTGEFFSFFKDPVIISALQSGNPVSSVEVLAPDIHLGNGGSRIGATFIKLFEERDRAAEQDELIEPSGINTRPTSKDAGPAAEIAQEPERRTAQQKAVSFIKSNIKVAGEDAFHAVSRRKKYAMLGAALIVLLVASTAVGLRQKGIKDERDAYISRLNQAVHTFEESMGLYRLDPKRSRELFNTSRESASSLIAEGVSDPKLDELREKLMQSEGEVLGEFTGEAELYLDLGLLASGLKGDDMVATGRRMFILDKEGKRVVSVVYDTKRSEVVAGPALIAKLVDVAAHADNYYIVQDDGIYKTGRTAEKLINKEWMGEVVSAAYLSNVYVLEKGTGKIWRYPATASGFGNRQNWLLSGVEPDFSNVKSMVIDGSIWLLSGSGQVFKYNSGIQRDFRITGLYPDLANPAAIYTNEDLEYLYVLDNENSRVVVLDKNGEFKYQYLAEEVGKAKGFAVSEKDKKVILLVGDKLLSIELRH